MSEILFHSIFFISGARCLYRGEERKGKHWEYGFSSLKDYSMFYTYAYIHTYMYVYNLYIYTHSHTHLWGSPIIQLIIRWNDILNFFLIPESFLQMGASRTRCCVFSIYSPFSFSLSPLIFVCLRIHFPFLNTLLEQFCANFWVTNHIMSALLSSLTQLF